MQNPESLASALHLLHQLPQPSLLLNSFERVLGVSESLRTRFPGLHWTGRHINDFLTDPRLVVALQRTRTQDVPHSLHDVLMAERSGSGSTIPILQLVPLRELEPASVLLSATFRDPQSAAPELLAREMARALAHEIRNPLGGLRGIAQLLQKKSPEHAEYTNLLVSECDRLSALVERLLHRSEGDEIVDYGVRGRLQRHNAHASIERALQLIAHEFPSDLQLSRDFDPSLPELKLDPDALTQALLNLLRNAVEARQAGQKAKVRVSTRAAHQVEMGERLIKSALRIDVEDHGIGVPDALRERLFLPLVTGKSEGTGFGLATSLEIAELHGGGLRYQSTPGRTIFSIFLPFAGSF